jgi:hypothetical protein
MSTTPTVSSLYDVNDFKVAAQTADADTAPTYSASVDVPGIAAVSMQPGLKTAELKGDAKVLARKGTTDRFSFSCTYGKISLDALVVFFGGTVTDETTPTTSVHWDIAGTNALPYFRAEFQILQGEVADTHVTAHKAQVTGGTLLDQSTDAFGQPKVDFEAIPCLSDDDLFVTIEFYDAATPLT